LLITGYFKDMEVLEKLLDSQTQLLTKPLGFTTFAERLDNLISLPPKVVAPILDARAATP
jgi:hypothetical protein